MDTWWTPESSLEAEIGKLDAEIARCAQKNEVARRLTSDIAPCSASESGPVKYLSFGPTWETNLGPSCCQRSHKMYIVGEEEVEAVAAVIRSGKLFSRPLKNSGLDAHR